MDLSDEDLMFSTLMAYREAANQGDAGITAVLCVARNNSLKRKTSLFTEVTFAFRYSSMNCPVNVKNLVAKGSIQEIQQIITGLSSYPKESNSIEWGVWTKIKQLVIGIASGAVGDITNGATLYYSTEIEKECPWDLSKVVFTTQIGSQRFYRELA